jgi:hypothetical protein
MNWCLLATGDEVGRPRFLRVPVLHLISRKQGPDRRQTPNTCASQPPEVGDVSSREAVTGMAWLTLRVAQFTQGGTDLVWSAGVQHHLVATRSGNA